MYVRLPIFNDEGMDTGQTAVLPVQALPKGAWWIETRKEEDNGHNGDLADHSDHHRDNLRSDVHLRPEVNVADTCCGKCSGTCYVDQITGA